MVAQPNNSKGFSLIELMVVVAIIGLLAVVASPYTGTWITSSQVQTAKANLVQAHARAKAAGLRGQPSQLTWTNDFIYVCENNSTCDAAHSLWQAKNPSGITIELANNTDKSQLWFDSRGRAYIDQAKTTILSPPIFEISKGASDDTLSLQ